MEDIKKKYDQGLYSETIKLAENRLRDFPEDLELKNILAEALFAVNKADDAIKVINEILHKDSKNWRASNHLAIYHKKNNNFKEALKILENCLNKNPKQFNTLFNISLLYFQEKKYQEALKYISQAIISNHEPPISYLLQGKIYIGLENYQQAEKSYKIGLEHNPNSEDLLISLSELYLKIGYTKLGNDILINTYGYFSLDIKKKTMNNYMDDCSDFIGQFSLKDKEICENIINFFEENKSLQKNGIAGGKYNLENKNSIDITINPKNIPSYNTEIFNIFINQLNDMFSQYTDKFSFLKNYSNYQVPSFNIQKYDIGGHYNLEHCERESPVNSNRYFAWMTYLNDVNEGGETEFSYFDKKIKPLTGKTLIWPSDWTHAHKANKVDNGLKYILTGWIIRN